MALKIENISTRFLLQNAYILFLIGILVFVLFLSSSRKKNTLAALSDSKTINSEIQLLNNNLNRALSMQISDADFVDLGSEKLISDQSAKIKSIIDTLDVVRKYKFLRKSLHKNLVTDSLTATLKNYNRSFESIILSLKEKGNMYAGKVGRLSGVTEQLKLELMIAPDKGNIASQLSQYSEAYFTSLDLAKLRVYKDFCQNLTGYYSTDYPSFDNYVVGDYVTQIVREIYNIELIDQRLKNEDLGQGQMIDLLSEYQNVKNFDVKLDQAIQHQINRYFNIWNIVILFISMILTGLLIFSNQIISTKLSVNIKSLLKNTKQLKEGNFENGPEGTAHFEFEKAFDELNSLRNNLYERTVFVDKLLQNDFAQTIELQGTQDQLTGKLIDLREKLLLAQQDQEKRDHDNEIRRYINEGLAKFGDIMRVNSNNTIALGDSLIKELVKYLGALQGGMFLTDETDTEQLNLISSFAYDRKKFMEKTIKKGDGLVGTCAIEKKKIYLSEVPKDYIQIKSGLGDTPPDNLLLVPVIHEDDLVGVLEIASLKKLVNHEIDLAEQIADSLATTIITVRNNTKTAQLLEKSQQQAAEMAEQEEEMRQNMEELKATQEESARREEEMQEILDAIGTSFYVIEYYIDGSISHVNERVVKFLNEPYEALIGKKHPDIFSSSSLLNSALFNDIITNKESKNIVETLNWGSKVYRYNHNLSPVISKYGDIIKVLNILSIDEQKNSANKR
jgi:GAF domain-containing protein